MSEILKQLNTTKDVVNFISNLPINQLEQLITYSADKYYNSGESVISDAIYDMLIDYLKLKSPKSKVLTKVGAKVKGKNKVKLDYWLGSMDKIKPPSNQLSIWSNKYKPPYNLSDKLDGISALLCYNNGTIKMFTRGTATEGLDITPLVKYLDLPSYDDIFKYCDKNNIKGDKNMIAFRGELIMKDSVFNKKWSETFKNARNSVAGLVNSKTINPEFASDTDLVLYEVVDPFYPIDEQLNIISEIGFKVVTNKQVNQPLTYDYLSEYLKQRRSKSEYQIDGIIVTSVTNAERNIKGNPEYAFAFKDILEDQKAVTKVISIEWNISKNGYINPTLILEPVNVGGVEIKRATGNNAKFIVDNLLGAGAQVEIIRSGDVIPKVIKIIKPAKKPDMPTYKYKWNETKVDIMIEDVKDNEDVLIKSIYFFFSTINTKGLGEKNIEKLIDAGLDTIPKILSATKEDFLEVEGFKEKSAINLVESINKSTKNIPLAKLMAASNRLGHGLGTERFKLVLSTYPNLMTEYKEWSKIEFIDKIKAINGWEDKTASLFVSNFKDFIKFYESIKKYITLEVTAKVTKSWLTGLTIVMTGFRDGDLTETIEKQGGKVGSSVSKNTNYLIVKDQSVIDNPTEKIKKAQDLGIKIITKDNFLKKL